MLDRAPPWFCLIGIAALGCAGAPARAPSAEANQFYARTWTTEDGLPHNIVTRILQDRTGFMWMGTVGGLARFDGQEFKTYRLPPSMCRWGYNIRGLTEDRNGLLLLLPNDTLARFDGANFRPHAMNAVLRGKSLTDLFAEPEGAIWVGTKDGTLLRWDQGRVQTFGRADGINRRLTAFSFAADGPHRIWLATDTYLGCYADGRLTRFDGKLGHELLIAPARTGGIWVLSDSRRLFRIEDGQLARVLSTPPQLPTNVFPHALLEDGSGAVWVATITGGLYRFYEGHLDHFPDLPSAAKCLAVDREGDLWVGTEGNGVSLLRPQCFSLDKVDVGGGPDICRSVCEDGHGVMWMVDRKGRLSRKRDGRFEVVDADGLFVNAVCPEARGGLWIGAREGLYRLASAPGKMPEKVATGIEGLQALFCDRSGGIWFGNRTGRTGCVQGSHVRIFARLKGGGQGDSVNCFAQGRDGVIWCGTEGGALWRFSGASWSAVPLSSDFPSLPIHGIATGGSGALWIGTADGLVMWKSGRFRRFTEADGLPDAMIFQVLRDHSGNIWIGTRRGFCEIRAHALLALAGGVRHRIEPFHLGPEEGMPEVSLRNGGQPLSWADGRGILWFSTDQGLLGLNPAAATGRARNVSVVIEQRSIDGRRITGNDLRVPAGRHRLELKFTALSYAAPGETHVFHEMIGIDPGWIESGAVGTANYSSMPAGSYRFQVAVRGEDDRIAAATDAVSVDVVPPWWQSPWTRAGVTVVLLGTAALSYQRWSHRRLRRRLRQFEEACMLERERARISRDLHDELGGSLTRIVFLLDRIKRHLAGSGHAALVEQLERRVRRHSSDLRKVVWTVNPRNNTVEKLAGFIGRYAQAFFVESGVECFVRSAGDISAGPSAPNVQHQILSVVKEAFTNILRHSHARQVFVSTRGAAGGALEIEIRDDGVGFDPDAPSDDEHFGLSNMRSRLAEIGGEVRIASRRGAGTTIVIRSRPGLPRPPSITA